MASAVRPYYNYKTETFFHSHQDPQTVASQDSGGVRTPSKLQRNSQFLRHTLGSVGSSFLQISYVKNPEKARLPRRNATSLFHGAPARVQMNMAPQ